MKKQNFTAERVAGFKCMPGKQQSIYRDGKSPGLGLRVTASGTKSYIFETALNGKTIRLTIGDPRTWKIAEKKARVNRWLKEELGNVAPPYLINSTGKRPKTRFGLSLPSESIEFV